MLGLWLEWGRRSRHVGGGDAQETHPRREGLGTPPYRSSPGACKAHSWAVMRQAMESPSPPGGIWAGRPETPPNRGRAPSQPVTERCMAQPDWLPARHLRSAARHSCTGWFPAAAPLGTGTLLLAPHRQGTQAIAPPGVPLACPVNDAPETTVRRLGWRWALWAKVDWYPIYTDSRPPDQHQPLPLRDVVQLVTPDRWGWVHRRCRALLLSAVGFGAGPRGRGIPDEHAKGSSVACAELIAELEDVFPNSPWRCLVPALSTASRAPDAPPVGTPRAQSAVPPRSRLADAEFPAVVDVGA